MAVYLTIHDVDSAVGKPLNDHTSTVDLKIGSTEIVFFIQDGDHQERAKVLAEAFQAAFPKPEPKPEPTSDVDSDGIPF